MLKSTSRINTAIAAAIILTVNATAAVCTENQFDKSNSAASLVKPTPQQVAWHDTELGMFIHFGLWSWPRAEDADLYAKKGIDDIQIFNPSKLDTDQWVRVAESMGAKYIVITVKHGDGFCMWQTDTTEFSLKNTPWRDGKGDILAELSESCRKRGMKLGVYINPRNAQRDVKDGGRAVDPAEQDAYDRFYRRQLTEVLSRYGRMFEVWFDGNCHIKVDDILAKYAPGAMILQSPQTTLRWVGNEGGHCPYPAWNTFNFKRQPKKHGLYTAIDGDPTGDRWMPLECDARIRKYWMYRENSEHTLKELDELMDMYYRTVGRGAVLLLNHTPDTTGRIPEADARRAAEFGDEIRRCFGKSLAEVSSEGQIVEIDLGEPTFVDHVITMEDIIHGERVRRYMIEGLVDEQWKTLCSGTAVGHKRIDRFPLVKAVKLRFRAEESVDVPKIRKFAAYRVGDEPLPPSKEAVAHFNCDTLVDDKLHDSSGNNYHGKSRGAVIEGGALRLDGDAYVDMGDQPFFFGDFTITARVKPSGPGGRTQIIVAKESNGVPDNMCQFYLTRDYRLGFQFCGDSGGGLWPFEPQSAKVAPDAWSKVAVTRQGDSFRLFLDRRLVGEKTSKENIRHNNLISVKIGAILSPGGSRRVVAGYDGLIDDVLIFNRTLSQEEIASR